MDSLQKKYYFSDINKGYYEELFKKRFTKDGTASFVFEERNGKKKQLLFLVNQDYAFTSLNQSRKFKINPLAKIKEFTTQVLKPFLKYPERSPLHTKFKDFSSRSFQFGSILKIVKNGSILDLGGIYSFLPTGSKETGKTYHQKRSVREVQLFHIIKLGLIINKENEIFFNVIASRRQSFLQHLKKLLKVFNHQVKSIGEFNASKKQKVHIKHKNVRVLTLIPKKENKPFLKKVKEIVISYC